MTIFEVLQLCLDIFAYATNKSRNIGQRRNKNLDKLTDNRYRQEVNDYEEVDKLTTV